MPMRNRELFVRIVDKGRRRRQEDSPNPLPILTFHAIVLLERRFLTAISIAIRDLWLVVEGTLPYNAYVYVSQ